MADYKLSFTAAEIDEKLGMVAQPDWSQNDESAAGYIKNRPFYECETEPVEILRLEDIEFYEGQYASTDTINIEVGKKYIVNWDGTEYTCIASEFTGVPVIGNCSYLGGEGNGEPFLVASSVEQGMFLIMDFEETSPAHTIVIFASFIELKTIDTKYIKDMYYDNGIINNVLVEEQDVGSFEFDEYYHCYCYEFGAVSLYGDIITGNTYIVNWDGTEYELVAEFFDGYQLLGDVNYSNDEVYENADLPFLIEVSPEGWHDIFTNSDNEYHTLSITNKVQDIKQIDEKYLPILKESEIVIFDGVVESSTIENLVLEIGDTYSVVLDGVRYDDLSCFKYVYYSVIGSLELNQDCPFYMMSMESSGESASIFETSLDGDSHTLTIIHHAKIIDNKYISNINAGINIIQSDLGQTDESAQDFVKGILRNEHLPEGYPYKEIVDDVIYDGIDVSFSYSSRNKIYYHMQLDCKLIVGETYVVTWDGVEYPSLVAYTDSYGWITLGSSYDDIRDSSITKEIPFCMFISGNEEYPECDTILSGSSHNITIVHKKHVTHTIAKEFIPSGTSSWNDLADKPFYEVDLGVDAMTITWDGNPDGHETFGNQTGNMYMCKLSDAILPLEAFDGATLTMVLDGNTNTFKLKVGTNVADASKMLKMPIIVVSLPEIGFVIYAVQEDCTSGGLTLSAGLYFMGAIDESGELIIYVSKLQTVDAIRTVQIEEKFMPDAVKNTINVVESTEFEEWTFELEDGSTVTKKVVVQS